MNVGQMITATRAKVGEPDYNNSKWTNADITEAINSVKRRIHGMMAQANPEAFISEVTVVLPADQKTATIPWPSGVPGYVVDIFNITNGEPGTKVYPINYSERHIRSGQGIHGSVFFSSFDDSAERTFIVTVVNMVGEDLSMASSTDMTLNIDVPEDLPAHLHKDLLVVGAAIELVSEMPVEVPEVWWETYKRAERSAMDFAMRQHMGQAPHYGELYLSETIDNDEEG